MSQTLSADVRPTDPPPFTAISLVFAILSLLIWWVPPVGGILALIALVLSWIGARSARANPGRYIATMMPTATRVVAGLGLVLAALVFAFWLLVFAIIGAVSSAGGADPGHGHHHRHDHQPEAGHEGENDPQLW